MSKDHPVAVVTGASRGIGLAIARRLAHDGARVVLNSLPDDGLEDIATALRSEGAHVAALEGDIGNSRAVDKLFALAESTFGTVDVLVNNAGWATPRAHLLEMDLELWDKVLRTNLTSIHLCSHRAANIMVDHGHGGAIINMSSFAASRSHRNGAAYDASKGGVEAFTRSAALDLGPFGIRVNAVGPGDIQTERLAPRSNEEAVHRRSTVPLGRIGEPNDIAGAVAFLASDDASYITGQVLYVDGGVLAQLRSPQIDTALPDSVARRLSTGPSPEV